MAKYIDIEKLKAEIERLKNHAECSKNEWINEGYNQNAFAEDCRIDSFDKLLSFIDSLQQEQSEVLSGEDVMTMCNQILLDWVKEGKTQKEKEQREQAHIRFFELYDDYLMQEQPEVDLEKKYTEFVVSDPVYSKLVNGIVGKSIARHFYELGLNAKKK